MKYPNRTTAAVLAAGAVLTCSAALVAGRAGAQEKQMTVAMITHAQPGDTFWDIIRKGAEAAAKKDNIKLIYLADPTATKEAQLISNVVEQHVDGIALTLAFPDAEASAVKAAQRGGSSGAGDAICPAILAKIWILCRNLVILNRTLGCDKAALSSGCKPHPAIRSSRKQPEQAWK